MASAAHVNTLQDYIIRAMPVLAKIPGFFKIVNADEKRYDVIAGAYPDAAFAAMIINNLFHHDREFSEIHQQAFSSNPDNDPRGPWTTGDLTVGMTGDMRPNQYYDLVDPKTGKVYKPNYNRVWSYIPESMAQLIAENRIVFPEDTSKRPMKKRFASELDSDTNPQSTWMDSVGMNTEGTKQMYDLFGKAFFSYTKPESLVKTLSLQATKKILSSWTSFPALLPPPTLLCSSTLRTADTANSSWCSFPNRVMKQAKPTKQVTRTSAK